MVEHRDLLSNPQPSRCALALEMCRRLLDSTVLGTVDRIDEQANHKPHHKPYPGVKGQAEHEEQR